MTAPDKFTIQFDWRVTLLAVLLMPVLLSLGFWQLNRAEEKRQLEALFAQKQALGPRPIAQLSVDDDLRYQPVMLKGHFMPGRRWLLDNRIYRGQFGYEVVEPFLLQDGSSVVLVNRGWVAGDKSRRTLPEVVVVGGELDLTGDIYVPLGSMLRLDEESADGWPRVVQTLEVKRYQNLFKAPLFPYTVRLHGTSRGSLEPSWSVVNVHPEKHTGYAVQWFSMSVALVIITILANTNIWSLLKRRRKVN